MTQGYTATAKQNPGRKSWLVEFRHPLKPDTNNKPGRKLRKGLGTEDAETAHALVGQLNLLLSNDGLWARGARSDALKLYDPRVVEIFFDELEPRVVSSSQLRDKLLPLPSRDDGYAQVLLVGLPGAGKTTLLRQLIGTHPKSERFPSTSVNRTTTFPTEVALRGGPYEAAVTFMSEYETRFEIEEALSSAFVEALGGDLKSATRAFLEKSDMRFRLKYILGDVEDESDDVDPYDDNDDGDMELDLPAVAEPTSSEQAKIQQTLKGFIARIETMAMDAREAFEGAQSAKIIDMSADDRNAALDLLEEQAVASEAFLELVSDILDEIRTKFALIESGAFDKTTTGWPRAWHVKRDASDRSKFLSDIRCFGDNHRLSWGKLLSPLVSSMRVVGPFKPTWSEERERLVFIDTEGLGHKADATADLPEQTLSLIHEADVVLLVESAKSGLTSFAAGKALEAVVNTGHTQKLALVFTNMDLVKGDNLRGQAKFDHVFGGLRNLVENQLAKNISTDAARNLLDHLKSSTFYVGRINEADPAPAKPELNRLTTYLSDAQPEVFEPVALPEYRPDKLGFAIQDAAREFRSQWKDVLGFGSVRPKPWQTIKALSRRYSEGWDDGFVLRPASNLSTSLTSSISRFLETPISWTGNPTPDQKRQTIDSIKSKVTKNLPRLSVSRVREQPQPRWSKAYLLRGRGTSLERASQIEGIFEAFVPVPDAASQDREVWEFLDEVKDLVMDAINEIRLEISAGQPAPESTSDATG